MQVSKLKLTRRQLDLLMTQGAKVDLKKMTCEGYPFEIENQIGTGLRDCPYCFSQRGEFVEFYCTEHAKCYKICK